MTIKISKKYRFSRISKLMFFMFVERKSNKIEIVKEKTC